MRFLVLYHLIVQFLEIIVKVKAQVSVVTVASNVTKTGYKNFMLSAKAYGIPVKNLNENGHWNKTSMKIYMLREFLANFEIKNPSNQIILFVDSYDLIFLSGLNEIIRKFKKFSTTKVLLSAELYCSPKPSLAKRYPTADKAAVYPYLNSGGIIGYLPNLQRILNYKRSAEENDDQLFYTYIYLNKTLKKTFQMALDHDATIFMSLAGAKREIMVVNATKGHRLENIVTKQQPPIIHGQGPQGRSILKDLYNTYFGPQFENILGYPRVVKPRNTFKNSVLEHRKVG